MGASKLVSHVAPLGHRSMKVHVQGCYQGSLRLPMLLGSFLVVSGAGLGALLGKFRWFPAAHKVQSS